MVNGKIIDDSEFTEKEPSGVVAEKDCEIGPRKELLISGPFKATVECAGDENRCTIEADENYLDDIDVEYENGRLSINCKGIWLNQYAKVKIITTRMTENLKINGSYRMKFRNAAGKSLNVEISGESKFKAKELLIDRFSLGQNGHSLVRLSGKLLSASLNVSGHSAVQVTGVIAQCVLNISGNSDIDIQTIDEASVVASGNSKATLQVTQKLTASASGNSLICYSGIDRASISTSGNSKAKKL